MTKIEVTAPNSSAKRVNRVSPVRRCLVGFALLMAISTSVGCFLPIYSARPERRVQQMLYESENLRAMVADAIDVTPPRDAMTHVTGYAMRGGKSPISLYDRRGLEAFGGMAGAEILTADHERDPESNVASVQTHAPRDVDNVISGLHQQAPATRASRCCCRR